MYRNEKVSQHIIRIIDIAGVACYLVIGQNKAILFDTCCGYGNLKEYVTSLTDLPIEVVLTHGHYDHIGSASLFDTVYMNHKDLDVLKNHVDHRKDWFTIDQANMDVLKDVNFESIMPLYKKIPIDIQDYEIFDLGNLHVQMVPVPGHTKGIMCPLILEERTILFGDACGNSVLLLDEFSTTVSQYLEGLENLKKVENLYDTIYRNHGNFVSHKILLDNVMDCCKAVLNHTDDHILVHMMNRDLYQARKIDGKEGNLFYSLEKGC